MAEVKPALTVEIGSDPTVNYAVQQNAVSVIKRLRLTNHSSRDLDGLTLAVVTEPRFAHPWAYYLERLPADSTYDLGTVDLVLSHDFLAQQAEAVRGSICVSVRRGEEILLEQQVPIDVLAYDQWNGMRAIPEILAAFVLPNHPAVERTLTRAGLILKEQTGNPSFEGYQTKDIARVRSQVAAIYAAIQQERIVYCGIPASFEQDGQKIRTPDRILETRLGNCLDLSTLFAACFEQAGLHPLLCLPEGHAFPGVWLTEECFADSVIDDALALRKRIDLDEICVLEATLAVDGSAAPIAAAIAEGRRHFTDPDRFVFGVDIRRARMSRIRPLPVRYSGVHSAIESPAALPQSALTPPVAKAIPQTFPVDTTPVGPVTRLDRWKRKLLDLTLRNRLLNFQETKSVVPLLFSDLPVLENALAEGKQLELLPRAQDWQGTERDTQVHMRRTGEDAEKALLLDELNHRRLRCNLESTELTRRLTETFRSARSSIEENGANTLYLALGMLVWYETKTSTQPRRAPILLIPVELQRRSAQSGYTMRRIDEEAAVNVTLLELLRHDFDLTIDGLDPLPEDESGIDVRQVLDRVRQAIKQIDRWDVVEEAYVGLFSFTKFLMWRDLEVRSEDLTRNRLVSSLINFPHEPFPMMSGFPEADHLDDDFRLDETYTPVSADSSQLVAVYAAGAGKSYVLHGPPGTGKSQTITNIIAQTLAQGKTVLFVAEKMAALNVVQRRLEAVGLGPFCLELHSNKSRKADVLAQLETSLRFASVKGPEEWQSQAERLAQTRGELNAYVRALHRKRQTGESFFTGLTRLMALGEIPRVTLDPKLLATVTAHDLQRVRDQVREVATAGLAAGNPAKHVWRAAYCQDWTPQWRDEVAGAIAQLNQALQDCKQAAEQIAPLFGLAADGWSWRDLAALKELAELILARPAFAAAMVAAPDWEETSATVERWVKLGRQRNQLRTQLYQRYTDRVLGLDLEQLAAERSSAAPRWFLPRWLTQRRVLATMQTAMKPGQRLQAAELDGDIALALELRRHEKVIALGGEQARTLLGRLWQDGEADWEDVARACEWAASIRNLAARLAGEDLLRGQDLRRRWVGLMTEQPELLRKGGAYAERLLRIGTTVTAVTTHRDALTLQLSLKEEACWGEAAASGYVEHVSQVLADWLTHLGQLRLWCAWMRARSEALALNLGPLIAAYEQGQLTQEQIEPAFEHGFYSGWVDQIVGQEEELRRFSRLGMEERIHRFRALDDRFSQLTRQEIQSRLAARIPRYDGELSQGSEVGILRRELQKRSRHMALRTLFQHTRNLLPRLKPCLLMSPISVAQYLDPAFPRFDLVVFDEASQVPTWDAVGAVARGAETIIVGDPQQLPPTSFFARADDGDGESESDAVAAEDLESILDDCLALTMPELHLRWHYRSQHESLIAFSNYQYYKSSLFSFPSPVDGSAVSLRHVPGQYDRSRSRTNRIEAEAVVTEVVKRLRDPATATQSVGVVTFSMAQQRLVEDLLDDARRQNPAIEPYFNSDLLEPVLVKNLENVQGDERDVILFSICYGPDSQGRVSGNFGPLNRDGGHRRLNVAITRARQEVVVFTSLRPEQIDLSRTKAVGVHHLKLFMEYAQRGMTALAERVQATTQAKPEISFDQQVSDALTTLGYQVQTQVGCSEYRIDLAVADPANPNRFSLGIECDGPTYEGAKTVRDRDKLRAAVLRGLGWRLHRIWITDWWQDREGELQRLVKAIETAREGDAPSERSAEIAQAVQLVEPPMDAPEVMVHIEPPTLPTYFVSQAAPSAAAMQMDFFGLMAAPHIQRLISTVVQEEGPLSLGLLCRRVAPFWGIQRMTGRVVDRVSTLASRAERVRIVPGEVLFLWPSQIEPETYTAFRVPQGEERSAEDLPPEEIANALQYVLKAQVALPVDELVRSGARLFGYQRIGQNVDRCLRAGIALLVKRGQAEEREGTVVCRSAP